MPGSGRYPTNFEREIWDAPDWAFTPQVTMSSGKAARYLGMSRQTLMRKVDHLGLTVIRRQGDKGIFFLRQELDAVRELGPKVTASNILEGKDALLETSRKGS